MLGPADCMRPEAAARRVNFRFHERTFGAEFRIERAH